MMSYNVMDFVFIYVWLTGKIREEATNVPCHSVEIILFYVSPIKCKHRNGTMFYRNVFALPKQP